MEPLGADDPRAVGAYRLLRRLGSGGMGRVYLGRSAGGRTVAVKVVHPHFALDRQFRQRFAREVAAAQRVGGTWTAPLLDADPDAEVPWAATGFIAGPDLQQLVDEQGALPAHSVRALGAGLTEALTAVHAQGLVHRDVKPSNVLLTLDGPRLIDFGIARASDATAALTATGAALGSPGYMAPEQVLGEIGQIDPATDVFALGAVLAFASSGRPPFPGSSPAQLLYRVVHGEPDLTGVPAELLPLIAACLAKDPGARPAVAAAGGELSGGSAAGALFAQGWLPAPVVEGLSRRTAELLDLEGGPATEYPAPAPAPATAAPAPATAAPAPPPAMTANPYGPAGGPPSAAVGFGPPMAVASQAPGPAAPRRRRWPLVLGALVAAGALAAGGLLLSDRLGGGDPGGSGATGGGNGTNGNGTNGDEVDGEEADADQLPEEYVGVWEGQLALADGLPLGDLAITLEPGGVGDALGTAVHTPVIVLYQCVDTLTLREVEEDRMVFDALVDWEESTDNLCMDEEFEVVLSLNEHGSIDLASSQQGDELQAALRRTG